MPRDRYPGCQNSRCRCAGQFDGWIFRLTESQVKVHQDPARSVSKAGARGLGCSNLLQPCRVYGPVY